MFADFARAEGTYGPTDVLPTPVYFYGLPPGEEILVDLEPGKTMVVRCQALGEPDEEGQVRAFFELNGQPRMIRVPDRSHGAASKAARPKAEDGNPCHVGAPMPGIVATVAARPGQAVKAGDVLLSIEAMKMETVLHAERDGVVEEVLVSTGSPIDAKDLLVVFRGE